MRRLIILALTLGFLAFMALPAAADNFAFNNGDPDGKMATASRPGSASQIEIESADDFILTLPTLIKTASFTGLLPTGAPTGSISQVVVEIYRVFPNDSDTLRTPQVNTRTNSPSDVAFATRDSAVAGQLTFTAAILASSFTANNSVLNGIFNKNHLPSGQFTGGEGPVTGEEVKFTVNFTTPFNLPPDHYFFIPQVQLTNGDFFWLSSARTAAFSPDLQSWIRNAELDPDWSRVGADIVDGATPPAFNASFTISGDAVPLPPSLPLVVTGLAGMLLWRCRKP